MYCEPMSNEQCIRYTVYEANYLILVITVVPLLGPTNLLLQRECPLVRGIFYIYFWVKFWDLVCVHYRGMRGVREDCSGFKRK